MRKVVNVTTKTRVAVGDTVIAGRTIYIGPTTPFRKHGETEHWVEKPGARFKMLNGVAVDGAYERRAEGLWTVVSKGKSRFVAVKLADGTPLVHKVRLELKKADPWKC